MTGQRVLLGVAIVGGALALLTPLLALLPIFDPGLGRGHTNAWNAGKLGEALAVLLPCAVAGLAGLAGARLVWDGKTPGRALLMLAAATLLGFTIFTVETLGRYLFGPAVLFVVPSLWLQPHRR